jgi:hypothetical protein
MADQVIKAMDAEMKIELREVVRRTPEDTGDLRNTERVEGPERDGNRIIASIVAGGGTVDYALIVHEDLEAFHRIGQAKYIESVLNESKRSMPARIAKRIDLKKVVK